MGLNKALAFGLMVSFGAHAASTHLERRVEQLSARTKKLEHQLKTLKTEVALKKKLRAKKGKPVLEDLPITVHSFENDPASITYNPSALMAGKHVLTYIAGMPVVSSPYLGDRPAFDGSDLIVNISSINQDVRLMMQRNIIERNLKKLGYPAPTSPIIALSGAVEPVAFWQKPYLGSSTGDFNLGSAELDIAAALNSWVEAYLSFAYDNGMPTNNIGQRIANSRVFLSKSFVNIGNLDKTPFYFTAGQIFVPFGRFSSSMISSSLPLIMARTKARTVIVGYREHPSAGLFAAAYGFRSDTTYGKRLSGGFNLGYNFADDLKRGEIGVSIISAVNDAGGMQFTGGSGGNFQGFGASVANEVVKKIPAVDIHANFNTKGLSFTAEWVTVTDAFRQADLSMNGRGARPEAANIEAAYTFNAFKKPSSVALGFGVSKDALALRLPKKRLSGVFNISLWRDTVQSIEYRHDTDYKASDVASGINSSANTLGTGRSSDTVTLQLGVYF